MRRPASRWRPSKCWWRSSPPPSWWDGSSPTTQPPTAAHTAAKRRLCGSPSIPWSRASSTWPTCTPGLPRPCSACRGASTFGQGGCDMTLLLIASLFLPLFPLSIVLNGALTKLQNPAARSALLLLWPQLGVGLLQIAAHAVPAYFVPWALLTSGLYALRLLTVRDMARWAGFLATSGLALTWALAADDADIADLHLFAFWFSLPPALITLLTHPLTRRFGAAYAGLQGGLIGSLPRLSVVLALTVLTAVATPPFPGFFALLRVLHALDWTGALAGLATWLVWGWAATKLLQGFIFGADRTAPSADIGRTPTLAFTGVLGLFVVVGLYLTGGGL